MTDLAERPAFTDDELEAQALAADPDAAIAADAVPLWQVIDPGTTQLLPDWYMPAPMAGGRRLHGWPRRVVFLLIFSFLAIDAAGLCFTYGII